MCRALRLDLLRQEPGFIFYMLMSALGITVLIMAVPFAYDVLKFAGAAYLLWMAWQALKPGGRSPFQVRDLPKDSPRKLFVMGLVTNLLNPKAAVLYLSLLRRSSIPPSAAFSCSRWRREPRRSPSASRSMP